MTTAGSRWNGRVPVAVARGVGSQLADSVQEQDEAFRRFVVPELEVMLRVARRLTGDDAEAEDLVQETLIRAYRAVGRFDGRYPRAWLLTILRNTRINMVRKRRPLIADNSEELLAHAPAGGSDGRPGPEEDVLGGAFEGPVADAFHGLSEIHRQVVALVDIDGLSYREAAETLGVPEGTVMSRLHRARTAMRERLVAVGYDLGGDR